MASIRGRVGSSVAPVLFALRVCRDGSNAAEHRAYTETVVLEKEERSSKRTAVRKGYNRISGSRKRRMTDKKTVRAEKLLRRIFGSDSAFSRKQNGTALPVRGLLHPNNFQHYKINPLVFTWGWCNICKCSFVRCPSCGKSTCTPTIGRLKNGKVCDRCELSHQYIAACTTKPTEAQIKRAKGRLVLHTDLGLVQDERKRK